MPKLRTGRSTSTRFYLAGLVLALSLFGIPSPSAQAAGNNESFLVALLLKTAAMKERRALDIQESDRALETSERAFEEAEKRMTNAQETQNDQAIHAAREPLLKARAERKRLKERKEYLEMSMKLAEAAYTAVRDLLVSGKAGETAPPMCGLLSLRSGKVTLLKKDGTKSALQVGRPGFLEPGDEMMTDGKSAAEILAFDGRAVVQMDERSQLRLEGGGQQEQALRLLQGRLHCALDEAEVFAGLLQEQARRVDAEQKLKEALARSEEKFATGKEKTYTVRTPSLCCSVQSSNFTVELVGGGATAVSVFAGAVEVGDPDCANKVRVEQDFKVTMTKAGLSEPRKITEADKWWEK